MATFYYNRFSDENYLTQWSKYIQNQSYIDDVTKSVFNSSGKQTRDFSVIVSYQTKEISDTIKSATKAQVAAIQQSTNVICGTLENGFELLSDNLQEISYGVEELRSELNEMASMLDWKLSLLIEQQRITNLLMGNIAVLLRIPDIQKERQYHIEKGIKFLKNSIINTDFYEDSLTNLLKAEKIEPSDFFVLHRIGLIHMYSTKHLALDKAEEYFKKAAKYAVAETDSSVLVTTNYLTGDLNKNLTEQTPSIDSIKLQAAESYLFAGRSCYIQGKFNEAAYNAGKGFSIVPQMVEAGFIQAKALAANNNESQAANVLEQVIKTDRFYSLKTMSDLDLCPKPCIQALLKRLKEESTRRASHQLQQCRQIQIQGSNASDYLDKIERLINKNTYLTSKKAIDLLEKVKNWNYCEPLKNPKQEKSFNEIMRMIHSVNNLKYVKYCGSMIDIQKSFVDEFAKWLTNETQWNFLSITTCAESHSGNFKVFDFLQIERKYHDTLPSVVENLMPIVQQYVYDNKQHLENLEKQRRIENLEKQRRRRIENLEKQRRLEDIEKQRIKAEKINLAVSVGVSFLGSLTGVIMGLVTGIIFGTIFSIGSCIGGCSDQEQDQSFFITFYSTIIIFGIVGAIVGYFSKRNKNYKN